ncbi:MAG: CBS domain-containing protein [Haloquadratum sp.]|jgi:Zn-dependent protease/CBS domain-containing protein|nr:CBS domain-containing protein [Haloferacaceae archaeon]MDR9444667.1 CBS domain-containing protein [Haloquadratum sp.]
MRGIQIGSVLGIPIRLNLTFLLILPIFAWLIGSDVAQLAVVLSDLIGMQLEPTALTGGLRPWILGSAAAIGLFVCVLLHEFGHSIVAMRFGYEIDSITLWLLGGVASFSEMPEDWREELAIAVAGPAVSVGLGVLAYAVVLLLPSTAQSALFVMGYLALTNIVLAAFNLLPGFPMDGGRVLRALLARTRPHARATQLAAEVGKAFAILLGFVGLFMNIFLLALAFFIYMGASSESQQTVMKAAFEGVTVRDIMTPQPRLDTVESTTTVAGLLDRMLSERHTGYPVLRAGSLVGMVTLDDARDVAAVERDALRVEDVMSDEVRVTHPETPAMDALETLQQHDIGRLPVVADGELVGLVSRSDLMRAFSIINSDATAPQGGSVFAR